MRTFLAFALITVSLAGCASEPLEEVPADPVEPMLQSDLGNATVAEVGATAWVGEYAAGPSSVAAFEFVVPDHVIEVFGQKRIGIEAAPILPGDALRRGYIQVLDENGTSQYHTILDGVTIRFRGSPPSLPASGSSHPYIGASTLGLPPAMAGQTATIIVGLDTEEGIGGIAIRTLKQDEETSRDATELIKRIEGTVGVLPQVGTSEGFATHIYIETNIFLGIINLGIELWTSDSTYSETVPADLRPAAGVQDFSFSGDYEGDGHTRLSLVHSGTQAVGTWGLTGDLHGEAVDEGGVLTGGTFGSQDMDATGAGGAQAELTFQGAKATTLAEVLIMQLVSRNHDFAEETAMTTETNSTVALLDDLTIRTPGGTMVLAGTGGLIRDMAGHGA